MEFIHDTLAAQEQIEQAIKRWGFATEHNFWWYQYYQDYYRPPQRNIFVMTDEGALFTAYNEKNDEYFVVFDPLAPRERRIPLLAEYIGWTFAHTSARKIWFQLDRTLRPEFLKALPESARARRIYYTMESPIYDLVAFDPALPGGHFKSLRKEMHKFYRDHQVAVADAKTYPDRAALHAVVDGWRARRPNTERAMTGVYDKMIDGGFEGTDEARVFLVDGTPAGINAGWVIPNSDRFYGAVGIHDYSVDDLGAMLYLEDLVWLKAHGYREADMGPGEGSLTAFKRKFLPSSSYQTAIFSVSKEEKKVIADPLRAPALAK